MCSTLDFRTTVFDLKSHKYVNTFYNNCYLHFNGDGTRLVGFLNNIITVYDSNGQILINKRYEGLSEIKLFRENQFILCQKNEAPIILDFSTAKVIKLCDYADQIYVISTDGQQILTGSTDGTIIL